MSTIVPEDRPCVACGYALRGLPADGACPECGMSIRRSLSGDQLWAADPKWLARIARGQWLVACGMFLSVVGSLVGVLLTIGYFVFTTSRPGLPSIVENVFTVVLACLVLAVSAGLCMAGVGVFSLMAQEGRDIERESMWSARNLARMSVIGAVVMAAMVTWLQFQALPGLWALYVHLALRVVLIGLVTLAATSLLTRVGSLVRRAQDEKLLTRIERERKFIRWGAPVAGIYLLLLPMGTGGGGNLGVILAPFACIGFIAMVGLTFTIARMTDSPAHRPSRGRCRGRS